MEKPFEHYKGVIAVDSGYTGGPEDGPTYQAVSAHSTGHREAIRVVYDPKKITYDQLLSSFWHNIDPTQSDGQFCDRGHQYTTAIYTATDAEAKAANASETAIADQLEATISTEVLPAAAFWLAEVYHQDYYTKNPENYIRYRTGCGRDARLKQIWGDQAGR